jgi:excisionase family DNA binding protein
MDIPQGQPMTEDFISVDDIAKALDTDRKTIYGAVERKEIPCIRIGRLIRIPRAWLRRAAGQSEPAKREEVG